MFYVLKCYVNAYILHTYMPKLCPKRWFKSCLKYKFRMVSYG